MGKLGSLKLHYFEGGKKAVFEAKVWSTSTGKHYRAARISVPYYIAETFIGKNIKVTIETIKEES